MRVLSIVGGVMLSIALVAPVRAQADLIVNGGGFESSAIAGGSFQIFPSIPGWTTTIGGGIEIQNNVAGAPFAGGQLVELDSTSNSGMRRAPARQRRVEVFTHDPGRRAQAIRNSGAKVD